VVLDVAFQLFSTLFEHARFKPPDGRQNILVLQDTMLDFTCVCVGMSMCRCRCAFCVHVRLYFHGYFASLYCSVVALLLVALAVLIESALMCVLGSFVDLAMSWHRLVSRLAPFRTKALKKTHV